MTGIERVAGPGALGECPVWSEAEQVLYWADIDGRRIHRFDPTSGTDESVGTSGRPGSFALTELPGRLLVAMEHELVWFDWAAGSCESWVALEAPATGNRLNDGRCDPAGCFVVGSMWEDTSAGRTTGGLYRVDGRGHVTTLRCDVGVANGLAFDPERARMYFADTPTRTIVVWDHDAETGERNNERVFFDYGELPGKPDGAAIDADGCYWSASVRGSAVIRITPDGELDRRIELPVAKPTMPAFGGGDLRTLFVTSIADPEGGGELFALDPGVAGLPEPAFADGA